MPKKPRAHTTRLGKLEVSWRITTVKVPGWGAFGDAVRFGVEIVSVEERLKVA